MKHKISSTIIMLACSVLLLTIISGWMNRPLIISSEEIKSSATKSLLILQQSGYKFINRNPGKCASCHHNTLTSMAAGIARQKGIPIIDSFTQHRIDGMERTLHFGSNPNLMNEFITGANFVAPYMLLGLYAEKYPPSVYTDIAVDYLISQSRPDGGFLTESGRVPLETGEIHLTAMSIRAIQLYAAPAKKNQVYELVEKSRRWLERARPEEQQELSFQLLGIHWCGGSEEMKEKVAEKLISIQHADGGWSQQKTLKSDAYATGQTLCGLYMSGMIKTSDSVYQNGLAYLLKTQENDGSWFVGTRAYPIQPFFNSDFPPYDENQFISATATNWAVMALLIALPDKTN
jgi:hypothetical protein